MFCVRAFASASRVEEGSDDLTEFIDLFEVKRGGFQLEFVIFLQGEESSSFIIRLDLERE